MEGVRFPFLTPRSPVLHIAILLLANVLARDLDIPPSTIPPEQRVLQMSSPQSSAQILKSKEIHIFLLVGVFLSLVALGFAVMLHRGD